ncbi:uncharacterized protein [Elaeis guineensis]|uniref:uncharacterized protein n=1 Tax=Elaeis guineensis var. tenera TaxID=51953 RepID=UPI003C6D3135
MAANRYRDQRCRLHKYCNELQAKGIDPVTQPYRNWAGSSDDWRWLCEHFGSEAFQRRSEANKVNRSKIDSIHTQGSASFAQGMKRMGLSGVDAYAKFYQNKSGEFVTEETRQHHEKMLELREQATREVGSDGDTGSQQVCLMTDDTILDIILGRQLGSGHSMRSKKSRSSSSGRSDDASVPEAVRTSMSMMQDHISYWMNRSQTLERIVAAVAGRLGLFHTMTGNEPSQIGLGPFPALTGGVLYIGPTLQVAGPVRYSHIGRNHFSTTPSKGAPVSPLCLKSPSKRGISKLRFAVTTGA